ncbi:unnamed protein product [Danaus chrysippus]|uniref:(African queen) hypothetical protein n=1 Tax=Danaus chrysippus TaxID=151541 RepID=A0A8J2QT48_9NEOP|nr:unnamed protein product [Danaus chrysippus]
MRHHAASINSWSPGLGRVECDNKVTWSGVREYGSYGQTEYCYSLYGNVRGSYEDVMTPGQEEVICLPSQRASSILKFREPKIVYTDIGSLLKFIYRR